MSSRATTQSVGRAKEPRAGSRLTCIDALRGIAALGVVFFHTTGNTPWTSAAFRLEAPGSWLLLLNSAGFAGVYLFFVISGFCIHQRWTRENVARPGAGIDFRTFWIRRIQRLYPTYVIALVLYLGVRAAGHSLDLSRWGLLDITAHLAMLHNLDDRTALSICGVFWTLAVEEQLYLAYFLLLKLRARWGWASTLGISLATRGIWMGMHALLAGLLVRRLHFYPALPQAAAMHWFAWSLGAVGVEHAAGLRKLPRWCRSLGLAAVTLAVAAGLHYLQLEAWGPPPAAVKPVVDFCVEPLWGAGFFFLVLSLVDAEARWREAGRIPAAIHRVAGLGTISYSLYCTHILVMEISAPWIHAADNPYRLMALVPLAVLFAWVFYRLAEKPFIPKPEGRSLVRAESR